MQNTLTFSDAATTLVRTFPPLATPPTLPYGLYMDVCNGVVQPAPIAVTDRQFYAGQIVSTRKDILMDSIYNTDTLKRETRFRVQSAGLYHISGAIVIEQGAAKQLGFGLQVGQDPIIYGIGTTDRSSANANPSVAPISIMKYLKVGDVCKIIPMEWLGQPTVVMRQAALVVTEGTTYISINKM